MVGIKKFEDNKPTLYFLTTISPSSSFREEDIRCIGYYISLEYARSVVKNHYESLCEAGYYRYVVIEAFSPGWYPSAKKEEWYEFTDRGKKVKKIKKPKQYAKTCNFGIG